MVTAIAITNGGANVLELRQELTSRRSRTWPPAAEAEVLCGLELPQELTS